jgi:uracil-DNA glycosylase
MNSLDELNLFCKACQKCRLHETRINVVFGEGFQNATVMFIGEGPGFSEDKIGRPFVGKAGQLLDKMLDAINFTRESIYITNIVKCRPPDNRNPMEDEAEACLPYLRWQVKLIQPKIIVCLGAVASKYILDKDFKISRDRGKWQQKGNINFIATYHPAYLLRNPSAKREAWEDFKAIRDKVKEIENSTEVKA